MPTLHSCLLALFSRSAEQHPMDQNKVSMRRVFASKWRILGTWTHPCSHGPWAIGASTHITPLGVCGDRRSSTFPPWLSGLLRAPVVPPGLFDCLGGQASGLQACNYMHPCRHHHYNEQRAGVQYDILAVRTSELWYVVPVSPPVS